MQASLLDEHQQDVLGGTPPPDVGRVLQQSIRTRESTFHLGRIWTAATPVSYGPRRFFFVIEVHPLRGFFDGTFAIPALNRLALALLVAGIFCLILTRHIVAPVRALQVAALRLAAGISAPGCSPSLHRVTMSLQTRPGPSTRWRTASSIWFRSARNCSQISPTNCALR